MDTFQIIVFSILCFILFIVAVILFKFTLYITPIHTYTFRFIMVFNLIIFCSLMLVIIYYNPLNLQYDKEVKDAEQDYIKHSYEQYFSKHLKHIWQTALSEQFNYYIIIAVILIYLPFVFYILYLLYSNEIPVPPTPGPLAPGQVKPFDIMDYFPPLYLLNVFVILFTCMYVFIYGNEYKYLTIPITIGLGSFAYSFLTLKK